MDKILRIHEDDMDIVVQPSVPWMELNEQIASSGLFFPVDPGPTAQIGGMVGTNCSGTNAVRYGAMKDWVLNLTVVLAGSYSQFGHFLFWIFLREASEGKSESSKLFE
jgi:D-lactate dehydrogenase (cytochrome)